MLLCENPSVVSVLFRQSKGLVRSVQLLPERQKSEIHKWSIKLRGIVEIKTTTTTTTILN